MDPLAQLHDIQAPNAVDWWPLAWGWWVVFAIVITLCVAAAVYWYRRKRFLKAQREALEVMTKLAGRTEQVAANVNPLLKRVAKHYFSAQTVSSLHGDRWLHFLLSTVDKKHAKRITNGLTILQNKVYHNSLCNEEEAQAIIGAASTWLKQAKFTQPISLSTNDQETAHV